MTHPDTLTIPRAVVEQAIDVLALYAITYNLYWIRGMPILEPSAEAVLAQLRAALQPSDPMDWPLPCDVTVGHGTMSKGVKLRTLIARMKALYEMATGQNADEVEQRSLEKRQLMSFAALQPQADTSVLQAAPWPPAGETLTEPEAMRYDFDGYGWKYIDNGSGSDWMTRHPEGEFLFTKPQAAAEPVAWIRKHPDGTYSNELLCAWQIEKVRRESGAWTPLYTTPPATQAALTAALDYLWVVVEHNRLHFGDSHNTVIQGKAAIAQIEALKGPTP